MVLTSISDPCLSSKSKVRNWKIILILPQLLASVLTKRNEPSPPHTHTQLFFQVPWWKYRLFFKIQHVIAYYHHYSFWCSNLPGLATGSPSSFDMPHQHLSTRQCSVFTLHCLLCTGTLNLSFSPKRHCRILNTFSQTFLAFPTKSEVMWLSWEGTTCGRPAKAKKREMTHNRAGLPIWVGFLHL